MLIIFACLGGKEKRKTFEVVYLVQVQVQEKVPLPVRCFSIKKDIKLWMIFLILLESEHAKSTWIHFFPPLTLPPAKHGVSRSG